MQARVAALAMVVGVGLGALAVQGLHAQAKPPVFVIFEAEVKDKAALWALRADSGQRVTSPRAVSSSCSARPQMYSAEVKRPTRFR